MQKDLMKSYANDNLPDYKYEQIKKRQRKEMKKERANKKEGRDRKLSSFYERED